jgi:ribonuclease R
MTYEKVNLLIEQDIISEGYEEYAEKLKLMHELAHILRRNKENRGYIDFNIDEAKIIVNEKGEATDVVVRNRGEGEKVIEDFMIVANETVATHFFHMDYPLVYRIHGEPSEEKITSFLRLVNILGYRVNANLNKLTPKVIQSMLNQLMDKKEFYILSSQMLCSMQKAVYDTHNIGHFGLASKIYCHFTSPIRRYPDLTVHRSIRKCLINENVTVDVINSWEAQLPGLARHSSEMERAAIECEREVTDMKMAEYMMKHIGEEFKGIITGVMSFGFFVQLPNMVEGLVRVEELRDDFYTYDESTFTLVGNKNKKGYRLGDTVNVIVKDANKETHRIDFVVVKKGENEKEENK